jgi:galactose mutarotase-like enzyme
MKQDRHTLTSDCISATIAAQGAELVSLQDANGIEAIWQAGQEWRRHAPVLFPIVGRLKGDQLRHHGRIFPMTQHGFARDKSFAWTERSPSSCTLVLRDDADSRTHYPFAFRLAVTYTLEGRQLSVIFEITNTGAELLPASIGAHPAFNWPLLPDLGKTDYTLTFATDEPAPIRRLKGGLVLAAPEPTPVNGSRLGLSEQLFERDAVIFDRLVSTSVRYVGHRGPALEISWRGFNELGVWSKPGGAPFLCIEPWHGMASSEDFDGEFLDKPGLLLIEPGRTEAASFRINLIEES